MSWRNGDHQGNRACDAGRSSGAKVPMAFPALLCLAAAVEVRSQAGLSSCLEKNDPCELGKDIEFTSGWAGISSYSSTLDGRGHAIRFAPGVEQREGIFGKLDEGAVVMDLVVVGTITEPRGDAGLLAGTTQGSVLLQNVTVLGNITRVTPGAGEASIGCLAGEFQGNATSCQARCSINVAGPSYVGGLFGKLFGSGTASAHIHQSSAEVAELSSGQVVGGLVGFCSNCTLNQTYAIIGSLRFASSVTKRDASAMGGLIGVLEDGRVAGSYSVVHSWVVTATHPKMILGGFVGQATAHFEDTSITSCFSVTKGLEVRESGGVAGHIGGFVGFGSRLDKVATLNMSWAYSEMDLAQMGQVGKLGGFVGEMNGSDGSITDCHTYGWISYTRAGSMAAFCAKGGNLKNVLADIDFKGFFSLPFSIDSVSVVDSVIINNQNIDISSLPPGATAIEPVQGANQPVYPAGWFSGPTAAWATDEIGARLTDLPRLRFKAWQEVPFLRHNRSLTDLWLNTTWIFGSAEPRLPNPYPCTNKEQFWNHSTLSCETGCPGLVDGYCVGRDMAVCDPGYKKGHSDTLCGGFSCSTQIAYPLPCNASSADVYPDNLTCSQVFDECQCLSCLPISDLFYIFSKRECEYASTILPPERGMWTSSTSGVCRDGWGPAKCVKPKDCEICTDFDCASAPHTACNREGCDAGSGKCFCADREKYFNLTLEVCTAGCPGLVNGLCSGKGTALCAPGWRTYIGPLCSSPDCLDTNISSAADLAKLSVCPTSLFVLTRDITAQNPIAPISGFAGKLDGKGFSIRNLTIFIAPDVQEAALFLNSSLARIANIDIEAFLTVRGPNLVQAGLLLTNMSNVTLENVTIRGRLSVASGTSVLLGCLAAASNRSITDTRALCDVVCEPAKSKVCTVGGLVGSVYDVDIRDCSFIGSVRCEGLGSCTVGGLVGRSVYTWINGSFAKLDTLVIETDVNDIPAVGGFMGISDDLTVSNCYATTRNFIVTVLGQQRGLGAYFGGFIGTSSTGSSRSAPDVHSSYTEIDKVIAKFSGPPYLVVGLGGFVGWAREKDSLDVDECSSYIKHLTVECEGCGCEIGGFAGKLSDLGHGPSDGHVCQSWARIDGATVRGGEGTRFGGFAGCVDSKFVLNTSYSDVVLMEVGPGVIALLFAGRSNNVQLKQCLAYATLADGLGPFQFSEGSNITESYFVQQSCENLPSVGVPIVCGGNISNISCYPNFDFSQTFGNWGISVEGAPVLIKNTYLTHGTAPTYMPPLRQLSFSDHWIVSIAIDNHPQLRSNPECAGVGFAGEEPCTSCPGEACTACSGNAAPTADGARCETCDPGKANAENTQCIPCADTPASCHICRLVDGEDTCVECDSGYLLNRCGDLSPSICIPESSCAGIALPSGGECIKRECPTSSHGEGCQSCTETECARCSPGYLDQRDGSPTPGMCIPSCSAPLEKGVGEVGDMRCVTRACAAILHCVLCDQDDTGCASCDGDRAPTLDGSECMLSDCHTRPDPIAHCASCADYPNQQTCRECEEGWVVSPTGDVCQACISNCRVCDFGQTTSCSTCSSGHLLEMRQGREQMTCIPESDCDGPLDMVVPGPSLACQLKACSSLPDCAACDSDDQKLCTRCSTLLLDTRTGSGTHGQCVGECRGDLCKEAGSPGNRRCVDRDCVSTPNCLQCGFPERTCVECGAGMVASDDSLSCIPSDCLSGSTAVRNCIACSPAPDSRKCALCSQGSTVASDGAQCAPCVPNCRVCSEASLDRCEECQSGYLVDSRGDHPPRTCIRSGDCVGTSLPSGSECVSRPCPESQYGSTCSACNESACLQCSQGYLDTRTGPGVCVACDGEHDSPIGGACQYNCREEVMGPSCVRCDSTGCLECGRGMVRDLRILRRYGAVCIPRSECVCPLCSVADGACLDRPCSSILGCLECSPMDDTVCARCSGGHRVGGGGRECGGLGTGDVASVSVSVILATLAIGVAVYFIARSKGRCLTKHEARHTPARPE